MHSLSEIIVLVFLSVELDVTAVASSYVESIKRDIAEFNISCTNDNCEHYEEDSLSSRACVCGIHCAQMGTCCFDSSYVDVPQPSLKNTVCRSVFKKGEYFIVDRCDSNDSIWANLCINEQNENDDIQQLIPVTSLSTNVTYKNYYCFRCNEESDDFLFWILEVKSKYALHSSEDDPDYVDTLGIEFRNLSLDHISLSYDRERNELLASYSDEPEKYFGVRSSMKIPLEIENITHACVSDVISNCSDDWTNEEIKNSCHFYMGLKLVRQRPRDLTYKNIHCALCNHESLSDIECKDMRHIKFGTGYGYRPGYGHRPGYGYRPGYGHHGHTRPGYGGRFSFAYLLDINRSDGELVGKLQKCTDDHLWDPFAKKCRKLSCALPGFTVNDGKCVKE